MMNFLQLIFLFSVVQSTLSRPEKQLKDLDYSGNKQSSMNEYPEYYEVKAEIFDFAGFYEKKSWKHKDVPLYSKVYDEYPLYLNDNGRWTIDTNKNGEGEIRSTPTGMPAPPNNNVWEFWNYKTNSWENDSSISVLPFEYPDCYHLEYIGGDENVKGIFEKIHLNGNYEKEQYLEENGVPYYVKPEPDLIYLTRTETNRWTFSPSLTDKSNKYGFMYQDMLLEPAPREDQPWELKMKTGKPYVETKGIKLTRRYTVDKEQENGKAGGNNGLLGQDNGQSGEDNGNIEQVTVLMVILYTCAPVVVVIVLIALGILAVKLKRKRTPEKPKIDENMYYGDEDYYDEHGSCVADTNDYYQ